MMSVLWPHLVIPMQTRVTDQPAFVLHRRSWHNSSLLLDLLTHDYGRVNLLAKGGKNNRLRGLFQPFCKITVSWVGRQELKTLTGIEGNASEIGQSLYLPLLYVNELIEAFLPAFEASTEIFALYDELLSNIDTIDCEIFLRRFERSAMQILGYMPDAFVDAESGNPIDPECCYLFQSSRGFIPCESDAVNAIEGQLVNLWNDGEFNNPRVMHLAKTIMRCIIDFNLHGKRLKSRDIYLQIRNWTHAWPSH